MEYKCSKYKLRTLGDTTRLVLFSGQAGLWLWLRAAGSTTPAAHLVNNTICLWLVSLATLHHSLPVRWEPCKFWLAYVYLKGSPAFSFPPVVSSPVAWQHRLFLLALSLSGPSIPHLCPAWPSVTCLLQLTSQFFLGDYLLIEITTPCRNKEQIQLPDFEFTF